MVRELRTDVFCFIELCFDDFNVLQVWFGWWQLSQDYLCGMYNDLRQIWGWDW